MFLGLEFGEEVEAGDVVEDDHGGEEQDADEGDLVDALLDRHGRSRRKRLSMSSRKIMPPSRMGKGSRLKMPRLMEIMAMVPMSGIQPGICGGLVDDLADADGAGEALDRDVALEHALEHVDDEQRVLLVELPARRRRLCRRRAARP